MMFLQGDTNRDNLIDEAERQALQGEVQLDASKTVGRKRAASRPVRPAMNETASAAGEDAR
jgi:hypothetical protein